jgi:hypothetical protein
VTPISSLGTFLTLSFLLPGIVILSSVVLLYPDAGIFIERRSSIEVGAAVLVVSFLNGHLCFLYEIYVLDYLWDKLYPSLNLLSRRDLLKSRSAIIASAEARGIAHSHFDTIFGEFILFTNSRFWMALLSFPRIFIFDSVNEVITAIFMFITSTIVITFTSPFFKNQYLSALEVIQDRIAFYDEREKACIEAGNPSADKKIKK